MASSPLALQLQVIQQADCAVAIEGAQKAAMQSREVEEKQGKEKDKGRGGGQFDCLPSLNV